MPIELIWSSDFQFTQSILTEIPPNMSHTHAIPGGAEGFSSPKLSLPGLTAVFIPRANIEVLCAEKSISPEESK